jgi:hypothetical protein
MQFSTCRSASAGDITSIRGDLGVNQDKLGHEAIEDVEGRRKKEKGSSTTDSVTDLTDVTEVSQKEEVNPCGPPRGQSM